MSARSTVGGVLASGAIIALGYSVGAAGLGAVEGVVSVPIAAGTSSTGSSASGSASGSTSSSSAAADGTYTGQSVSTRFGDVQVQVTISGGTITDVTALHLTDHDGRSVQISNRAAPILRSSVLSAQSADVAGVSGATYTSEAYLASLQSALDQAGF